MVLVGRRERLGEKIRSDLSVKHSAHEVRQQRLSKSLSLSHAASASRMQT